MDPTLNERRQRELAARINTGKGTWADARELAELVEALSEWINRGGFLPNPWDNAQRFARAERKQRKR